MELNEFILNNFQWDELICDYFQLECKSFMETNSYRLIEQKCNNKCLNPNERQQLHKEVQSVFILLIKIMKRACRSLTEKDVLFCCLEKAGLDNFTIGHCMGDVNKQPINQRKYRIKKKMKAVNCDFLFDMIFSRSLPVA